ncbi:hypothetical protein AAFF_G00432600 [Aldrovandia affinis]|uniref:Uncharacterized protein n=1 Tax=Aldrovandia affinis TaxID=143900 RepID=A0AAD7S8K8_9TELE|nr:hypothetical protein AAFF_G00432600 [Aldrovandia affinis]
MTVSKAISWKETRILHWTLESDPDETMQWGRPSSSFYLPERAQDGSFRTNPDTLPARIGHTARLQKLGLSDSYWRLEKDRDVTQRSRSPTRSFSRHLPIKPGQSLDMALRRDKDFQFTSCQPVKQMAMAGPQRNENKAWMPYQQDERARLRQKCVEMDRDEALTKLQNWTIEKDGLRDQLKISQDRTMNDRVFQIQRVMDLQDTILKLDRESGDCRRKISIMKEDTLSLKEDNCTLRCMFDTSQEELKKLKAKCSSLSQLKTVAESGFSDNQRNLEAKTRELQSVEERKKQLEERNDALSKQVSSLREEAHTLQSSMFQLNQDKDILQRLLDDKEKIIGKQKLKVDKVEISTESLQQAVRGRDRELEAMRWNLTGVTDKLDTAAREKEAVLQANSQLSDNLEKAHLDHKALQFKMEESSQELENLHRKLQDYITETSSTDELLFSKDKVIERLQLTVQDLEASALSRQQAMSKGEQEMEAVRRKLTDAEKDLDKVTKEKESVEKALQQSMDGSNQEEEILKNKLQEIINESFRTNKLRASKEKVTGNQQLGVEELEASAKRLQQAIERGEKEMEAVQRNLTDTEENLDKAIKENESTQEANTQLRDNLDNAQLDIQALQRNVEESNQELEELRGKVQDYNVDKSCTEDRLSYKDKVIQSLQLVIQERETASKSLQQAVGRGEKDLEALRRKLTVTEADLDAVMKEKATLLKEHTFLRVDLDKAQLENHALQRKVDMSNQDVEDLQRELQSFNTDFSGLENWLYSSEEAIGRLELTFEELETSTTGLRKLVRVSSQEVEAEWRKTLGEEEELGVLGRGGSLAADGQKYDGRARACPVRLSL